MHMVKWGVQLVASEPPRAPGYYNKLGPSMCGEKYLDEILRLL